MSKYQIRKGKYKWHKYGRLLPRRYKWSRIVCFKYYNPQCGNCNFCRMSAKKIGGHQPEKLIFQITLMRVCYIKDTFDYHIKRVFDNAV